MKSILFLILVLTSFYCFSQGTVARTTGTAGNTTGGPGVPGLVAGGASIAPATPTITEVGTLSAFSTTAGTASSSQTFTVSGSALTSSLVISAPTSYGISSNGTSYSSTLTLSQSGGTIPSQPITIYVRIMASASAGTPAGNIALTSTGATTVNVAVTGTVTAGLTAYFNFSGGASAVTGWTNWHTATSMTSPGTTSFTDASTGWTLQSISGGWNAYGGYYGGTNNGASSGTYTSQFPEPVVFAGTLYNYDQVFSSTYNYQFTNLAAGTYQIQIIGSVNTAIFTDGGTTTYHFQFGTGSAVQGSPTSFSPNNNAGTFTTVTGTITTGQTIKIAINPSSTGSNNLGWINALIITKTS